jgi:hypothetical protein
MLPWHALRRRCAKPTALVQQRQAVLADAGMVARFALLCGVCPEPGGQMFVACYGGSSQK